MKIIKANNYKVYICNNYAHILNNYRSRKNYDKIFILTDENTTKYCLNEFINKSEIGKYIHIEIQSGEIHKNLQTLNFIWDKFMSHSISRSSLVINLGGGVLTDMSGFAASTIMRGVDFINFPTTLLSMVDASIGGKLGVNFSGLKNYIGVFQTPVAVVVYKDFLQTLNDREFYSGYAEIIKHALISDAVFLDTLLKQKIEKSNLETEILVKSISLKKKIVQQDYKEDNYRKILNFGHTIGHAVESCLLKTKNPILHGEAVAIGIAIEIYLSDMLFGFDKEILKSVIKNLRMYFPKRELNTEQWSRVLELMKYDKKNNKEGINFVLLEKVAKCKINIQPPTKDIVKAINLYETEY